MHIQSPIHKIFSVIITLSLTLQIIIPPFSFTQFLPPERSAIKLGNESPGKRQVATQHAGQTSPANLDRPLSISRNQSRYKAGATQTITYTITNNQPIIRVPDIPETATVTDTVEILASFVLTDDINTLRQATVTTILEPDVSFVDASSGAVVNGDTVTWLIDDIAPSGSATITLTVNGPATAADFSDLDGGAVVSAMLWDRPVSAVARPAMLAPDFIGADTLAPTLDADSKDGDMLWKTASLGQDPALIFAYIRGMVYDPYSGSLRGTRGTLWGEAGNAIDQSSLLIAALRAAGIPAQYRHGTLATATAQMLIDSIFGDRPAKAGYLPSGVEVADPRNDSELLTLVQDHWWVEAYLPGVGWTDLDPSFPDAEIGDLFAASTAGDGTDRIAELPAGLRHTITLSLVIEQYSTFPLGGANLVESTPLTATLSTAQLAGKRLTLGHIVSSDLQGGVFSSLQHTYTPYFGIEELGIAFEGNSFQDLLSNFPLSSVFTTAEWLDYEIRDPDGHVEQFRRTIKDLIGLDTRLNGGDLNIGGGLDTPPFVDQNDIYVNWILPNGVSEWAYQRQNRDILPELVDLGRRSQKALDLLEGLTDDQEASPEQTAAYNDVLGAVYFVMESQLTGAGLDFARQADQLLSDIEWGLMTKMYYSSPRVFTIASIGHPADVVTATVDLRKTTATTIVYPGQEPSAARSAQWVKGVVESRLEGEAIENITGEPAITSWLVFQEMEAQGIRPVLFEPTDFDLLNLYPFTDEGRAHMLEALLAGRRILAPSRPVTISGEETLSWWEINPETGETVSVSEDGLHSAALEWRIVEEILLFAAGQAGGGVGAGTVISIWTMLGESLAYLFTVKLNGGNFGGAAAAAAANAVETISPDRRSRPAAEVGDDGWRFLPAYLCPIDHCGIEQFFRDDRVPAPVPLPEIPFVYGQAGLPESISASKLTISAGLPPGTPDITLKTSPAMSAGSPGNAMNFGLEIESNFDDEFTAAVYGPAGWPVTLSDAGLVSASIPEGSSTGDYTILVTAQPESLPALSLSTIHTVTVSSSPSVALSLEAEPSITVPMGPAQVEATSNQTNDGEAEIPGAAYTVVLTNTDALSHTYAIAVNGPPPGWIILDGVRQDESETTLRPGQVARVGLYLQPDPASLPNGGDSYPVTVSVDTSDGSGLAGNDNAIFIMPDQPFNFITLDRETIYASPGLSTTLNIGVRNVGNIAGSFPISVTLPLTTAVVSNVQSPVDLQVGEINNQSILLDAGSTAIGSRFLLEVAGPVAGSYTQYALAGVQVVSENSGAIFAAAGSCNLGSVGLPASLESLAIAFDALEQNCAAGSCSPVLRDQVVAVAESVAGYARSASPLLTAGATISAIAGDLASHSEKADIEVDLEALSAAVVDLETEVCELEEHLPGVSFTPLVDAVLLGDTAAYTLTVANLGNLTTTYAITVELPGIIDTFTKTLAPGENVELPQILAPSELGAYELNASAMPVAPDVRMAISDDARALLNVVDKFVQVTGVIADPAFVETGVSSTTLSVEVANVANVPRDVTSRVEILTPAGAISWTQDFPLRLLAGTPRVYPLGPADTSGWAAGAYTVSVELLDAGGELIPDGSGSGAFAVGQALIARQSVRPELVALGTVSVTTLITTEIVADTIQPDLAPINLSRPTTSRGISLSVEAALASEPEASRQIPVMDPRQRSERTILLPNNTLLASGITRSEQDIADIVYGGSWVNLGNTTASSGSYRQSSSAGATATMTFTGTWVNLGFVGDSFSGLAEVFIDGNSHGVIDLYRRDMTAVSFIFEDLIDATHALTLTVLGDRNDNSGGNLVRFDYFDVWDGTMLPDGLFEQDDSRIFRSSGWSTVNLAEASGGSYMRGGNVTAWFPFSGPSFTFKTVADRFGGRSRLYVDGQYLDTVNHFNFTTAITRTLSYTGFVDGLHVLQISGYDGNVNVDALVTPGGTPYVDPNPPPSSFTRYEEDDIAFLYNGVPFTQTARSWARTSVGLSTRASGGQYIASDTAGDEVSFTFEGVSLGLGFLARNASGEAQIYLDGALIDTLDLYRNEVSAVSRYYNGLDDIGHILTVTVAGSGEVALDFVDIWDGVALPDGTFDQNDEQVFLSGDWSRETDANAGSGDYLRSNNSTAWYALSGESVTFQAFSTRFSGEVWLELDGHYLGQFSLYTPTNTIQNFSFDGLESGVHVLSVHSYRGNADVDTFISPGIPPFVQPPPAPSGFTRFEEDDVALLYNGVPFTQTATTWDRIDVLVDRASDGQVIRSATVSDTIALSFNGQWAGVGFIADNTSGMAEIFVDGESRAIIDLYRRDPEVLAYYYDLAAGPHELIIMVLGEGHPNANNSRVQFDYIEVWDGATLPDGVFEENHERILYSRGWSTENRNTASNGTYRLASGGQGTVWFPFTGDSATWQAMASANSEYVRASIDGEIIGYPNVYGGSIITRTYTFGDLDPGLHVLQLELYRGHLSVDRISTPGNPPFFSTPVYSGVVRYEEDHPAMLYNGESFQKRPLSWNVDRNLFLTSGGYRALSTVLSDTVSLTFDGRWLGIGFVAQTNTGLAEVLIDGVSQGVVDTYSAVNRPMEVVYGGLVTGTHTVTVRVLDDRNPASSGDAIHFDFIDIWDGTAMPDGWVDAVFGEDNGRVFFSRDLANVADEVSEGGSYAAGRFGFSDTNAWFLFTGTAFTYLGRNVNGGAEAELFIDGVSQGILDLTPEFSVQPVAFHFGGLEDGPHVVRVSAIDNGRYDAFEANPDAFLPYVPQIEWFDTAPGTDSGIYADRGMLSTIAVGDLEGDGVVELVAPSSNGSLYVYRGDGADTGGGTPLLWSLEIGASAEPALADLDGDGDAEIVLASESGVYALHHDGSTLWFTDTVRSFIDDHGRKLGWGGPSIANLDIDAEPEIVFAANNECLCVFEADGSLVFNEPLGPQPTVPTLADITGDGYLDILVAQDETLTLYDYANSGAIVWTRSITPMLGINSFGAPAVADVDGQLPGGDPGPEIAIAWDKYIELIDDDGSLIWSFATNSNAYRPSHVAIADTDGDGEVEVIADLAISAGFVVLKHTLYVLNADGTLLWERDVIDNTASASGVSVHDLDGDGDYEVMWNGSVQGYSVFDGGTGKMLFNEPFINSGTVLDYPAIADVDGDGYTEVIMGDSEGIYVVGHDGIWAPARPLWNSHDYHVTNINDDWSVPVNEPPSWLVHNTYRTQTPLANPAPSYQVEITYTAAITGVNVLTDTFSRPAEIQPPNYGFAYAQAWYQEVMTTSFSSLLADMRPGEVRPVSQGTEVRYKLPSGINRLVLPPLYVIAPHIINLSPAGLTAVAGSSTDFKLTLINPDLDNADTYTLSVIGPAGSWTTIPPTATLAAGETKTVTLTLDLPFGAEPQPLLLTIQATNSAGGMDSAISVVEILDGVDLTLTPTRQEATGSEPASYTLTIHNNQGDVGRFVLSAGGLAIVQLPPPVEVPAGEFVSVILTATTSNLGPNPFTITVTDDSSGAVDKVDGVLDRSGLQDVLVALSPDPATAGPGTTTQLTAVVSNRGSQEDSYDLELLVPANWTYELTDFGHPINQVTLPPHVFNSRSLKLFVRPDENTVPGVYEVTFIARSQNGPFVTGVSNATVQVLDRGVRLEILSGSQSIGESGVGSWLIRITNTGDVADTYDLSAAGALALPATFSANPVTVAPGASETVDLMATGLHLLPGTYQLVAAAQSQAEQSIVSQDQFTVTATTYEGVAISLAPSAQTISDTLRATFNLSVTNNGNAATFYDLSLSLGALNGMLPASSIRVLPNQTAVLPLEVTAPAEGVYAFSLTAVSDGGGVQDIALANLTVGGGDSGRKLYLPLILR